MDNSLRINSETWPDVTENPHYIVDIYYNGFSCVHDDIYFDNTDNLISKLNSLEKDRKGIIELDGGFRFKLTIEAKTLGGIVLGFRYESDDTFPGKMQLEGYFSVEGENTAVVIKALTELLTDGKEFFI